MMPEFNLDYYLDSEVTYLLIAYTVLFVIVVIWAKKRSLKAQQRRMFYKRQKRNILLEEPEDGPAQLEIDF